MRRFRLRKLREIQEHKNEFYFSALFHRHKKIAISPPPDQTIKGPFTHSNENAVIEASPKLHRIFHGHARKFR